MVALGLSGAGTSALADIPDRERRGPVSIQMSGIYKVASSNDPLMPMAEGVEWFMDFGRGSLEGRSSGTVSVSLRRNPRVQVRIMVWQLDERNSRLLLGNSVEGNPNQAVARADWTVVQESNHTVLSRGGHQLVLRRPAPGEY